MPRHIWHDIIRLKEDENTHKEIAQELGVSTGYVARVITAYNSGFTCIKDYENARVRKNGYNNQNEYVNLHRKFIPTKQEKFERKIICERLLPRKSHSCNLHGENIKDRKLNIDEAKEVLEDYLCTLPPKIQKTLIKHYFFGMPFVEIAKEENVVPYAISLRTERGLVRLRKKMKIDMKTGWELSDFFD